jgi:SAM-dependent methyltransferase
MEGFIRKYLPAGRLRILDVGSQIMPHQVNFKSHRQMLEGHEYIGLDITPGINVDVVLTNPYKFPFNDMEFDVVISSQTFEHIEYPWLTIREIARVLKPGGMCFIIAPAKAPRHRYPVDCYRYNPDGIEALGKWAGFKVIKARTSRADRLVRDCYLIAQK